MDLWSPAGVGGDFSHLGGTGVDGAFSSREENDDSC